MFKKGDSVKTKGGYKARIIADNLHNNHGEELAVVVTWEDEEYLMRYPVDGEPSRYEVWKLTDDEELTPSFKLVHIKKEKPFTVFHCREEDSKNYTNFGSYTTKQDAEEVINSVENTYGGDSYIEDANGYRY